MHFTTKSKLAVDIRGPKKKKKDCTRNTFYLTNSGNQLRVTL